MSSVKDGSTDRRRGCLFCLTGQERQVASAIEMLWPNARAFAVCAAKRRSTNGVKRIGVEVILPSYVFFEVEGSFRPTPPYPDGVIRLLKASDGDWVLAGNDDEFARLVVKHDGVLTVSAAQQVGDRIVIQQGPLKDFEGYIQRIDKRNGNALVQLDVGGKQVKIWLPFEIAESIEYGNEVEEHE